MPYSAPGPFLGAQTASAYQISRSLRFRSSASAYLSRTPASAGNRKTWTWSGWVKRGALSNSATFTLFTANYNTAPWFALQFVTGTPTDQIQITFTAGSAAGTYTNAVFRDPSSWYHIVLAVDTTQSTASNRLKLYVNGLAQTFSSTNYPSLNTDYQVNNNVSHIIGGNSGEYFDGYLAEVNFIDGYPTVGGTTYNATTWAALNVATLFGAFDTNGVWQPAKYTGSYGTNGFYLPFSDNTNTITIGKDFAQPSGSSARSFYNNLSTSGSGWQSYGLRQLVPSSAITLGGLGTKIRLTIRDASGIGLTANSIKIGKRASSGNAWDFDGNQVQVTFSGSNSVTVAANSTAVSDWITFPLVSTSDLILACGFSTTVACGLGRTEGVTNYTSYELINGSANATDTAPTGYTGTAGRVALFQQLEIDGNHWNTNNISVTSGTTCDSMIDSPTNYADGGNGRGNYAVLNPIISVANTSITSANLNFAVTTASWRNAISTIGASANKYYFEATVLSTTNAGIIVIGAGNSTLNFTGSLGSDAYGWAWQPYSTSYKYNNGVSTAVGGAITVAVGDVLQCAFDLDNSKIWFGRNNTWAEGSPSAGTTPSFSNLSGTIFGAVGILGDATGTANTLATNFGQRPFTYTPPSGFSALNTQNLPTPTIAAGNKYFDATTYTGNGTSQSITNNGSFQPDLVWIKPRVAAGTSHVLTDAVRGVSKFLSSNGTSAESSVPGFQLTAFNSNGFTLVDNANGDYGVNGASGGTYSGTPPNFIAWQWKAGTAPTVDNTAGAGNVPTAGSVKIDGSNSTEVLAGSIAATRISANRSAGFSVIKYGPGTGANATVAHGLNATPSMIIIKGTNLASWDWAVYHSSLGNTQYLALNTTAAAATSSTFWYNTSPTSSVFSIGTAAQVNASTYTFVAYCFAPVAGYSAFGSYTGNGSADGPFVYTGFRPRFVLVKCSNAVTYWFIRDTSRDTYNASTLTIYPNASDAESSGPPIDILSNGFKCRNAGGGETNASGNTYIWAAFAENPFRIARAR